ncbi:hypothetical protein G7Y89_g4015 [Cudoniella acicularis]|uniref:Protein kinase domain-containing protein n=1 Tax=Cudoniella acicularis TaxID=354080 RepID=A0A8H4W7U8_9HELO|nr:hypothetical protein G7Y89_g4015 [Cudoniella acicularis]
MATLDHDHDPETQNLLAWIQRSSCPSVSEINHDEKREKRSFVPLRAVEAYLEENRNERLNRLLTEVYQPEHPPTYPEAILRRYTSVFCILLEIGKGNLIHHFTEHDSLRDSRLPFDPSVPPPQLSKTSVDEETYQKFCDKQWRYAVPIFERLLDKSFSPEQILPIVHREPLGLGQGGAKIWRIAIHEDYNRLQMKNTKLNSNADTFVLKVYLSEVDYEREVKAFRCLTPDQGILGFCGNYIQGHTFNILLEYADQGNLDQYFSQVTPPRTGQDIIKFWRRLFTIIRALGIISTVAWDSAMLESKRSPGYEPRWHLGVRPSNILVVSESETTPYDWKFKLADLDAPERSRISDDIESQDRRMTQKADIWSLGCVFSEAATWVAGGYEELSKYRQQRKIENYADGNMSPGNSFHDGGNLLDIITEHHRKLSETLRKQDFITQAVVDNMIEEMLEIPEGRPTAEQLWIRSQRILSKAEDRYAAKADDISEESKATIVPQRQLISDFKSSESETPMLKAVVTQSPEQQQQLPRPPIQDEESMTTPSSSPDFSSDSQDMARSGLPSERNSPDSERSPKDQNFNEIKYSVVTNAHHKPLPLNSATSGPSTNFTTSSHAGSYASVPSTSFTISSYPGSDGYTEADLMPQVTLSPRAIISDSEEFSSSAEQEYEPRVRSRSENPRLSRSQDRRLWEGNMPPLSLSEARAWKDDRKNGRPTSTQLDELLLNRLSKRDHIFLVDNASSMTSYWGELKYVLEVLSYMLKGDPDGVELYFTNSVTHVKSKHTTKLLRSIDLTKPEGGTNLGLRLGDILNEYGFRAHNSAASKALSKLGPSKRTRPINIYFLTDGLWEGHPDLDESLKDLLVYLIRLEREDSNFGIQFIKFGDNPVGEEHLSRIDNVDVTPSTGNVWKMLLGASNDETDKETGRSFMRLPAMRKSLRRMSTFSMRSSSSRRGSEQSEMAIVERVIPRTARPAVGLVEWHLPPREPKIDFVFIHDLDGHRERDWTFHDSGSLNPKNWPRDLLPLQFPNARVLAYGFDSAPWRSPYPIKDVITRQATKLLESFHSLRGFSEQFQRPIILISKGYGGLIAKSALLQSHLAIGPDARSFKALKLSTTGMILLEPPDLKISGDVIIPAEFGSNGDSNNFPVGSSNSANNIFPQFTQDPKSLVESSDGNMLIPGHVDTRHINVSIEVERVSGFHGENDLEYKKVVAAISDLCAEAAEKSRKNWIIYDSEINIIYTTLFGEEKVGQSKIFPSAVEIFGLGGIGKTQLALEFVHRYKHKFSTIIWIDSQSRGSVQKCFSRIERKLSRTRITNAAATQASQLNVSGSSESTTSSDSAKSLSMVPAKLEPQGLPSCSTDIVKAWLARENNDRWVMVFDGADDEHKSSWIQEFLPNSKHGHIIITSRHRDLLKYSTGIPLGPMAESEASRLLLNSTLGGEETPALELVKRLECIPLAITQAGAYIKSTGMSVREYLGRFKEAKPRAWDEYASRMNLIFSTSVDDILLNSYHEVKAKDHDALDLLVLCSFMAPESIPGVVLEFGSKKSGMRLDDMVDTLYNNGFGHREESLQSFRMHTLIQSWVRKRQDPDVQARFARRALSTLAAVVDSERQGSKDPKVFQGLEKLLLGHIIASLSRLDISHNPNEGDVSWCVLGNVCKQQKRYTEAVSLYQKGLSDPEITSKVKCFQRQQLRFELGALYQLQGKYNDAVTEYENTIEECDKDPPNEDTLHIRGQLLLDVYKALSSVYTRIGRLAQSGAVLSQGISKLEKLFGPNSFQTLQLLDVCATEYYDQEDYAQAETLYTRIVASQIQTLGIDHPGTLHAQEKLARVYFQTGKFHQAQLLCQQSLSSLEKTLDAQHPTILQVVLFLGRISTKLAEYPEAETYFKRAIKGYELLGLQHPETLNAREELAMCYEAQGEHRYKDAHGVYMQVMFGREDAKDVKIRETIRRLCALLELMGRHNEAKQLQTQPYPCRFIQQLVGHPETRKRKYNGIGRKVCLVEVHQATSVTLIGIGPTARESDVREYFETRLPGCEPVVSPFANEPHGALKRTTVTFKHNNKKECKRAVQRLVENGDLLRDAAGFSSAIEIDEYFHDLTILAGKLTKPTFDVCFVHGQGGSAFNSFATEPHDHKEMKMWARDFLPETLDDPSLGNGRYMTYGYPSELFSFNTRHQWLEDILYELEERTARLDIPVRIFYEQRSGGLGIFKPLTDRDSGEEKVADNLVAIGIPQKASEMAKFKSAKDHTYEKIVSPSLRSDIHNALRSHQEHMSQLNIHQQHHVSFAESPSSEEPPLPTTDELALGHVDEEKQEADSKMDSYSEDDKTWLQELVAGLQKTDDRRKLPQREDGIDGTQKACQWLLCNEKYKEFVASPQRDILIIEGGPGTGKSVLAKFLTTHLRLDATNNPGPANEIYLPSTITTGIFGRKEGLDNTPKAVVMQLLHQLVQKSPEAVYSAAFTGGKQTGAGQDFEFYWTIFAKALTLLKVNHFCIIDGLDEYIRHQKLTQSTKLAADENMEEFLERLWKLAKESSKAGQNCRTKFVLTYRDKREIGISDEGKKLLKIDGSIIDSVRLAVAEKVNKLATNHEVSSENEHSITEEILQRCGPIFQKCVTAVKILDQSRSLDLNDPIAVRMALDPFSFKDYDTIYTQVLEQIPPQDHEMCAKILRILYFTRAYVDLGFLQHALIVGKSNPSVQDLDSHLSKAEIYSFIRRNLGPLVKFRSDGNIELDHQTTYEFLGGLSDRKYRVYSCEKKEGHLHLALICLRYLTLWRHRQLSKVEIAACKGDRTLAAYRKASTMIYYASNNWQFHVREAAELIKPDPYFAALEKLLQIREMGDGSAAIRSKEQLFLDFHYMRLLSSVDGDPYEAVSKPEPLDQIHLLAIHNMTHVLSTYLQPISRPERRQRMHWVSPKKILVDQPSFSIQIQDTVGGTPLHYACVNGHIEFVKLLLDAGAKGNILDNDGYSAFDNALDSRNEAIAELVMRKGQEFGDWDIKHGSENLRFAAYLGYSNILKALLENKVDPNSKYEGDFTSTHHSAQNGHPECLKLLLAAGGQLEAMTSKERFTPLHLAASRNFDLADGNGHFECIKIMFQFSPGLNPSPRTSPDSFNAGITPTGIAAMRGYLDVFNFLKVKEKEPSKNDAGDLPIHLAIQHGGHMCIIRQLVEDGADLNAETKCRRTPLHLAAMYGHFEIYSYLLSHGAEPRPDEYGNLPVHMAASNDSMPILELFDGSPEISTRTKTGTTPFHLAAHCGQLPAFRWLRSRGAEDPRDDDGRLAIHRATSAGRSNIIREYKGSADLNTLMAEQWLPIHLAASNGHLEAIKVLKGFGAELDALSQKPPVPKNGIRWYSSTALGLAVQRGHEDVANYLLDEGCCYTNCGPTGDSLLSWAAYSNSKLVFLRLIDNGSDPFQRNCSGETGFHRAASHGSLPVCEEYLRLCRERFVTINIETDLGETPLHFALRRRKVEVAKRLMDEGADINHRSAYGYSALILAGLSKDPELIQYLLNSGAQVNVPEGTCNTTALFVATYSKDLETCKLLVSSGANVNARTTDDHTALIAAADYYNKEIIEYLLSQGADPGIVNKFGRNFFDYMENYPPIFKLLELHLPKRQITTALEKDEICKAYIRTCLSKLPARILEGDIISKMKSSFIISTIAEGLFYLKEWDLARLTHEIRVMDYPWYRRQTSETCRVCDREEGFKTSWYCKDCPTARSMCKECFETRTAEKIMVRFGVAVSGGEEDDEENGGEGGSEGVDSALPEAGEGENKLDNIWKSHLEQWNLEEKGASEQQRHAPILHLVR